MTLPSMVWVSVTALFTPAVASDILQLGKEGGTLGGQALLFIAVVVLGWVVISLDKRREAARTQEKMEMGEKFSQLMLHHQTGVTAWQAERATVSAFRDKIENILIDTINKNTAAFTALKITIEHQERNLKNERSNTDESTS